MNENRTHLPGPCAKTTRLKQTRPNDSQPRSGAAIENRFQRECPSAATRICPLAVTKKTWPSQSVSGFASRRAAQTAPKAEYDADDRRVPGIVCCAHTSRFWRANLGGHDRWVGAHLSMLKGPRVL